MFKKVISFVLSVVFSLQTCGFAQAGQLNLSGYLGQGGGVPALDRFRPASLRYFSYEPGSDNFQILLDKADEKGLSDVQIKDKADELMRYFRIGLSLPNDKFWVNLRPDAPEQIIDPALEQTDMGKIMLEADLQLKKDTSSLTSPQTKEGKVYWDKLYKKAGELFGTENITIPTITRPWIVPGEIIVRQSGNSAYIYKAALKVLLEEDYLTSRGGSRTAPTYQQYAFSDPRLKELNEYSTQLIRELIIPQLTKEVNRAKRYAGLRQVYYSLILARWFKQSYHNSGAPGNENNTLIKLIDSGNLDNLASREPWSKDTYYQGYKKSFEQGEYNLSETVHTPTGQVIRRYISGGEVFTSSALKVTGQYDTVDSSIVEPVNSKLLKYAAGDETVAAAASPLIESLKNKAINILSSYMLDDLAYRKASFEISREKSIVGLKEAFDRIVEPFKYTVKDFRKVNDFSNTLSALIIIEEADKILEEKQKYIKNVYETQASLSKKDQSENLLLVLQELKDAGKKLNHLARKIETEWAKMVSSPISQEMEKMMDGIKQKTGELELILNSLGSLNQSPEEAYNDFKNLQDLLEVLKSRYKEFEIEFRSFFDPRIVLPRRATKRGITKNLIDSASGNHNRIDIKRYGTSVFQGYQFGLKKEISIAGITYDHFYREVGYGFDKIELQRKGDTSSEAGDITLYVREPLEVVISDRKIEQELLARIMKGDTLDDIVEPIKEALIQASKVSSAITNEELKKKSEEMESSRKQLSEAIKVQQEEFKRDMEIRSKESIAVVKSQSHRDLLSHTQRNIDQLMISITEHREFLQKLIKQVIDPSEKSHEKSQRIDMIAQYINISQKTEEIIVESRKKIYSKFPYDSSLTSDDKEKILAIIGKIKAESREYYKKLREVYASSALTTLPLGGIDFRQMNMLIQPMGSFAGLDFSPTALSSSALEAMDLERDLEGINQMTLGRRRPHPQRLKEYVSACIFKGKIDEKADDFILSMLEVFQLQSEEGIESASQDREAVVLADTRGYALPEKEMVRGSAYSLN